MPSPNTIALKFSEISAFIRTDGHTILTRSTRLLVLIKNIYTFWGRKCFLLLSDESIIPFYSTSNGYNKVNQIARAGDIDSQTENRFKIWRFCQLIQILTKNHLFLAKSGSGKSKI